MEIVSKFLLIANDHAILICALKSFFLRKYLTMLIELSAKLEATTRESIRVEVSNWFLDEKPGLGKKELRSIYRYSVETLSNGQFIELRRPTNLNKGFDFEVTIPGSNFGTTRRTTRPSHNSILLDLTDKRNANPTEYQTVRLLIDRIYSCENVPDTDILSCSFEEEIGHPIEHILKTIRWLFIEQDITYWNWSGRAMFYSKLKEI